MVRPSFELSRPPFAQRTPRSKALLLAGATVLALVPFVNKAFHIDDTLFLAAARQIRSAPLDFYGFAINWYGTVMPMSDVMKNPPLTSYFIAAVMSITGEREIPLHLAFLLPAVAAILGTLALARRLCARPASAALVTLSTPVFLISATNLMCDTMLLAFWVWAVALWIRGIETRRAGPLMAAAVLAAYQQWTLALYGRGLLFDAASYATERSGLGTLRPDKVIVGLSFAGGCFAPAALFLPWLWGRAAFVGAALAALIGFAFVSAGHLGSAALRIPTDAPGPALQIVLFVLAGACVLALGAADLFRLRDAASLLLFLWLVGTLVFAVFFNWTINGRSLLAAAPAVGILTVRRLERGRGPVPRLPLAAAFLLTLAVTWSDFRLAASARTAAAQITRRDAAGPAKLWFEGHWGFQHYMEARGALPLDVRRSRLEAGDRIVIPVNNTNVFPPAPGTVVPRSEVDLAAFPYLTTMSPELGAGFYSDIWGPFPFVFGRVPPDRYLVLEVVRAVMAGGILG